MKKEKTAIEKAWKLVKDTLEDDEAYLTLRQNLPIQIKGSKGTPYYLYPTGRFAKLGKTHISLGIIYKDIGYAEPDYLATIIAWIKHDEETLEKNWNCGNFSITEMPDFEHEELRRVAREIGSWRIHRHESILSFNTVLKIIPILFSLIVVISVMPILFNPVEKLNMQGTDITFITFPEMLTASWPFLALLLIVPIIIRRLID